MTTESPAASELTDANIAEYSIRRRARGAAEAQRLWDAAVPLKQTYPDVLRYLHTEDGTTPEGDVPPDRLIGAIRHYKTGEIIGAGVIELYAGDGWWGITIQTVGDDWQTD